MSEVTKHLLVYSSLLAIPVVIGWAIPVTISQVKKHLPIALAFSAGLMLGAIFLHLFPKSYEILGSQASIWLLAGFLFLYTIEKFVTMHVCEALDCRVHTVGISAAIGLGIHALTDGIALGSGILIGELSTVIFLSIFIHKLPEAFVLTSVLMHSDYKKNMVALFNLFLILMVPLGAILLFTVMGETDEHFAGVAVAFSAGTFLHISLSDLLPEVHKSEAKRHVVYLALLLGLGIMLLVRNVAHI